MQMKMYNLKVNVQLSKYEWRSVPLQLYKCASMQVCKCASMYVHVQMRIFKWVNEQIRI